MGLPDVAVADRKTGCGLLVGTGIEIGAFHCPCRLPNATQVTYVDMLSRADALALFPEVDPAGVIEPDVICDLDRDGLKAFADDSLDFVVACHVLEHLANPLGALAEIFRVLRPGGRAAVAIPDKRFTFDEPRGLTTFVHLWQDYLDGATESSDEHYLDFLRATTAIMGLPPEERLPHIRAARHRREHTHVWDSGSFHETMLLTLPLLGYTARTIFESFGDHNQFEYFAIWEKITGP